MRAKQGYLELRRGIEPHLEGGMLSDEEFGVWNSLTLQADYNSGVVISNVAEYLRLRPRTAKQMKRQGRDPKKTIQRIWDYLQETGYIKMLNSDSYRPRGSHKSYPILINNYEVKVGVLEGFRLSTLESESLDRLVYRSVPEVSLSCPGSVAEVSLKCRGTVPEVSLTRLQVVENKEVNFPNKLISKEVINKEETTTLAAGAGVTATSWSPTPTFPVDEADEMRYQKKQEPVPVYTTKQHEEAAQLVKLFHQLTGSNQKWEPQVINGVWKAKLLPIFRETTLTEMTAIIKFALKEKPFWIKRISDLYGFYKFDSPFHLFIGEFETINSEYRAYLRQLEAKAYKEEAAAQNLEEYKKPENWVDVGEIDD